MHLNHMFLLAFFVAAHVTGKVIPSCYSTTDAYVVKTLTVATQPLSATLIQRYQGSELTIECLSFIEYGPTSGCGTDSVPQLCSRLVTDTSSAFSCETLSVYQANPGQQLIRGSASGPERIWLVKWDGTSKPVGCYPRQVEIRLLAFIRNQVESNDTVFGFLLTLAIISVLLVLVALYSYFRTRLQQIDYSGATTIGGPKQVFRGPQISVNASEAITKNVTTVYLPVRDSAALNEMTTSKIGQLLNDPNTPHRRSINLEDEFGENGKSGFNRGPGGSSIRRRRASPPAPGDGVQDPVLSQRMSEARRLKNAAMRRGGRIGIRGSRTLDDDALEDEEDIFDEHGARRRMYNGAANSDDEDDGNDYASGLQRSGPRGKSGNRRGGSARRQDLFPTQSHFTVSGGDDSYAMPRGGLSFDDEQLEIYEDDDGASGKPEMRGPQGRAALNRQGIKYVPQWMHGSFGRGGVIPEAGEVDDTSGPVDENFSGATIHQRSAASGGPGSTAAKRFFEPPQQENAPNPERQWSTPNMRGKGGGQQAADPSLGASAGGARSALKQRRSSNHPYESGAESDDALRRGVSFEGDYVTRARNGRDTSTGLGGRTFGGDPSQDSLANDNFSRNRAKVHNRALQLDPAADRQNTGAAGSATSQFTPGRGRGGDASLQGQRLAVAGVDASGNPVYTTLNGGPSSIGYSSADSGIYECEDCHQHVRPGVPPVFCPVSGLRHF